MLVSAMRPFTSSLASLRLTATSLRIASKFVDDFRVSNSDFATIAGISTVELNFLESEFLTALNFKINVDRPLFESYAYCILAQDNN